METPTVKKWYDNYGLIIFLCVIFFPVGLYGLWKSTYFSKGWKLGITIVIALIVIVGVSSDDKTNSTNKNNEGAVPEKAAEPDKVINSGLNGSVRQVKDYLKDNLKDWDSYESIDWGKVVKYGVAKDVIDVGELTKNTNTKTGPGKSFPDDSTGQMDKGEKVYVVGKSNGWKKIRTTPNDSLWMKGQGLGYWAAWVPENCIKQVVRDTITKYSVRHKYRAKNSFGGYEISDQTFYFDNTGSIIRMGKN